MPFSEANGPAEEMIGELMQRLQRHVFIRRIRCREFFNSFDPLRCGRCTVVNFVRAMDMAGSKMTDQEADALADHYTEHGPRVLPPAVVNYYKFCADVDSVFDSENMQDNVRSMDMTCSPGNTMFSTFVPQSFDEEDRVYHVMHRLAALCKSRGLHIKGCYTDNDRLSLPNPCRQSPIRSGKVTKAQFIRNFPFRREMPPEDIELLCSKYVTKTGDIHFMALHNDVAEVMPDPAQPFPTSPLYLRPDGTRWAHQDIPVLQRISAKVVEKRCRVRDHFMDFDPLRKGLCTPSQVKTVFTVMGLSRDVDRADFDSMLSLYMTDEGLFRYREFCDEIDKAFTVRGLEKAPLVRVDMPDAMSTMAARRNPMRLPDTKLLKISRVEEKIRTFVRKRRFEMKPIFQDFDRARRGYVTRNQFQRIMSMMQLDGVDECAVGLLAGLYCDFGNHNDFNYLTFLKSVDPLAKDVEAAMLEMTSAHVPYAPKPYFNERGRIIPRSSSMPHL